MMSNNSSNNTNNIQIQPNQSYAIRATSWRDVGTDLLKVSEPTMGGVKLPDGTTVFTVAKLATGQWHVRVTGHPALVAADGTVITPADKGVGLEGYMDKNKLLGDQSYQNRKAQKTPGAAVVAQAKTPQERLAALVQEKQRLALRLSEIEKELPLAVQAAKAAQSEFDRLLEAAGADGMITDEALEAELTSEA